MTAALPIDRAALARKYRTLLALRKTAERPPAALAVEFPGALRELDELPTAEIERRIATLEGDEPLSAALTAIGLFHQQVRAAPRKSGLGGRPSRHALAAVATALGVDLAAAHALVFPFARVRRLP